MKNGHCEDDTFHTTTCQIEKFNFKLKLLEVKKKVSVKSVLQLFFTSFRCL